MFEPVDSPYARYLVVAGEQTLEVWAYRHELRLGHEGQPVVTFYDSMGWKVLITAYDYIHCLGTPKQNEEQAKENAQ